MKIHKKLTAVSVILLCLVMMLSACAGSPKAQSETQTPENSTGTQSGATEAATTGTQTPKAEPDSTSSKDVDNDAIDDKIAAMLPVFDSVICVMGEDGYKPTDKTFFWTTLYLMAVNFENDKIEAVEDGQLKVPRQVMQEYATAFFKDYSDLLEIPKELSDIIKYDESWDAYMVNASDRGESFTEIVNYTAEGENIQVITELKDRDTVYGTYTFTLITNPYLDAFAAPVYYYTVSDCKQN